MDRVQGGAFVCLLRYVCPGCVSTFVRTYGYLNSADFLCVFSDHLSPHSPLSSLLMLFMSCGQSVVLEPKEVHGTGQLVLNVELLSLHNLSVLYLTFDSQNTC